MIYVNSSSNNILQAGRWRVRNGGGHIITGKGKGSPGRSVLQSHVRRLLSEDYDERIDWFEQDYSGGGFLVKLK